MAIGFRSVGTRLKVDTSVSGVGTQNVSLPPGHVSGDALLMYVLTDDNTNTTADPSGWTRLFFITPGASAGSPYTPRPHLKVYYRIDDGTLGSSVALTFNVSSPWPTGKPEVLAFIEAHTGCDVTGMIGEWNWTTTTSTTAAQAHPQLTLATANNWLVTYRAVSSDSPGATFTIDVGTDVERQDDIDTINELACATYDSNTALSAGLQTQRNTTASRAATYGSIMVSIALRPAGAAGATTALAGTATGVGTAFGATTVSTTGPWDLCGPGGLPTYSLAVDWDQNGSFVQTGMLLLGLSGNSPDEITPNVLDEVVISYGRDQDRQLSPGAVGNASARLCNVNRLYNPENRSSPLYGNLDPARNTRIQVVWAGQTFPLFRGKIDDYDIHADFEDRTVSFTFLDGLSLLQGIKLSTGVYESLRTGDIINLILNEMGWTAPRDIDLGATIVKFWWAEGTDALSAVQEIVRSEGPPSVAYVSPDGTFVFRARHHRLLRQQSVNSQGTFAAKALGDCTATTPAGLDIAKPFTYAHGWRDIINSVSFEVTERVASTTIEDVWTSEDTITLAIGQGMSINISGSDPFQDAITPVAGTDFTTSGAGTVNVVLNRDSGQSVQITLTAIGGGVTIQGLKLRARPIPVLRTIKVDRVDAGSITSHGERTYPDTAPWANANDAGAIADMILLHYSQRRPTVQLRVVTKDPTHFLQVLQRTISDRVHIVNNEMGIDDDFFVERITHTIQRFNAPGRPPVHAVVLGCERDLAQNVNPFRFDVRGAGFDDGVFDPISSDNAATVFIFDHPTQGKFDTGLFGT